LGYLSCHTHAHKRAERRARNIAGAEALAVARRPEVASREKNPAAAGIRRFFPLSKKSKQKISALVVVVVVVVVVVARHLFLPIFHRWRRSFAWAWRGGSPLKVPCSY